MVFGVVLLACVATVIAGIYQRLPGRRPSPAVAEGKTRRRARKEGDELVGWGIMIFVLILGYFAFIGTFGSY